MVYSPESPETAAAVVPVRVSVTVTFTLGMAAPCESETLPLKVPRNSCPNRAVAASEARTNEVRILMKGPFFSMLRCSNYESGSRMLSSTSRPVEY